jgi:hypothetical protein
MTNTTLLDSDIYWEGRCQTCSNMNTFVSQETRSHLAEGNKLYCRVCLELLTRVHEVHTGPEALHEAMLERLMSPEAEMPILKYRPPHKKLEAEFLFDPLPVEVKDARWGTLVEVPEPRKRNWFRRLMGF